MPGVKLTFGGRRDIEAIADYTRSTWGGEQTKKYLSALEDQLKLLAAQPALGMERPRLAEGLRSFPFDRHVIYYAVSGNGIIVVRVLHGRQEAASNF